jgi:hypothetical protein
MDTRDCTPFEKFDRLGSTRAWVQETAFKRTYDTGCKKSCGERNKALEFNAIELIDERRLSATSTSKFSTIQG